MIKDNKYFEKGWNGNTIALPKRAKKCKPILTAAAGTPTSARVTGNEYKLPQWRVGLKDSINPEGVKMFEVDRKGQYGAPMLCSSVNFKNMETKFNAWTAD